MHFQCTFVLQIRIKKSNFIGPVVIKEGFDLIRALHFVSAQRNFGSSTVKSPLPHRLRPSPRQVVFWLVGFKLSIACGLIFVKV